MVDFSLVSSKKLFGRCIRFPLRFIPRNTQMRVLQGELQGAKWIVGAGVHGYWLGSYELALQRLIAKHLHPGTVFFDVGANVGFYSLIASRNVQASGQVIAFEPLPENCAYLSQHVYLNQCENVVIKPYAISDYTGVAFFTKTNSNFTGHLSDSDSGYKVQVYSLDSLIEDGAIPSPDALKIDVEGEEYKVLLGASEMLEKNHPIIFLATHGSAVQNQCIFLLRQLGYTIFPVNPSLPVELSGELIAVPESNNHFNGLGM